MGLLRPGKQPEQGLAHRKHFFKKYRMNGSSTAKVAHRPAAGAGGRLRAFSLLAVSVSSQGADPLRINPFT